MKKIKKLRMNTQLFSYVCYLQQKPNISQRIFQMLHIIISLL